MLKTPFMKWFICASRVDETSTKGSSILDIGGSSPNIDQGALIELGYPHRPKQLFIFDLPPEEQYWGKPKFPRTGTIFFPGELEIFSWEG